jgi:hypothetical protein
MCPTGLAPNPHLVWIFLGISFDGSCNSTVRISFPQHRIYSGSKYSSISCFDLFLFGILWLVGIEGYIVALSTQLLDALF